MWLEVGVVLFTVVGDEDRGVVRVGILVFIWVSSFLLEINEIMMFLLSFERCYFKY